TVAVLDGAQLEEAAQTRPRGRERSVAPAGGHQQPVVWHPPSTRQLHELLPAADGGGASPEFQVDALLGVVAGGIDELILEPFLSSQIALRQRWTVIGQLRLLADELDRAVEAPLTQGRRRGGSGQSGADDHNALSTHLRPSCDHAGGGGRLDGGAKSGWSRSASAIFVTVLKSCTTSTVSVSARSDSPSRRASRRWKSTP